MTFLGFLSQYEEHKEQRGYQKISQCDWLGLSSRLIKFPSQTFWEHFWKTYITFVIDWAFQSQEEERVNCLHSIDNKNSINNCRILYSASVT